MGLSARDEELLARALDLAERGRGRTAPNPIVGAVVTRDGRVIGEGFHARAGQDHAEVVALQAAAPELTAPDFDGVLRGACAYVSLEPCSHFGRTPPCTDALIAAGVTRVVVAATDPFPQVSGQGLARLRRAGVEVVLSGGHLERRARRQNGPFRKWAISGLPFVTYKYAMTLDGKVAAESGHSAWISGEASRRLVHQERAASDAIVVGAGTMRADDPLLTARDVDAWRQPLRVVIDPRLTISRNNALVQSVGEGPVLVVCGERAPQARREEVAGWGIEVVGVESDAQGRPLPESVTRLLGGRDVQAVLLEGGHRLAGAWWEAGLVDRVMAFVAPLVVGGEAAPGPLSIPGHSRMDLALRLQDTAVQEIGGDVLITGYIGVPY